MVNKEQIRGGLIVSVGWREGKIARKIFKASDIDEIK